jgi:chromosome segregation ATPase
MICDALNALPALAAVVAAAERVEGYDENGHTVWKLGANEPLERYMDEKDRLRRALAELRRTTADYVRVIRDCLDGSIAGNAALASLERELADTRAELQTEKERKEAAVRLATDALADTRAENKRLLDMAIAEKRGLQSAWKELQDAERRLCEATDALRHISMALTTAEGDNVVGSHAAAATARYLARTALAAVEGTETKEGDRG